MQVFFSNQIEKLLDVMMGQLYAIKNPFARRLVMVATPPLKAWVMLELAEKAGIAAGLEVGTVEETFRKLLIPERPFAKTEEVALALEIEMVKVLEDLWRDPLWEPLIRYLGGDRQKITPFSFELARLFQKYNLHGNRFGPEWDQGGWQRSLWEKLFGGANPFWPTPYREYQRGEAIEIKGGSLDVFAVSFLPKVQLDFLMRLSAKMDVRLYCLSPCETFWSERGIDQPLLKNFGKVGQIMAKWIEESSAETVELYSSKPPQSLLEHLQNDMKSLRSYQDVPPIPLPQDHSIQLHGTPSLLREVEVVQQLLLQIVAEEQIEPRDILVMAPDISVYAPFIPAVFDGRYFTPHVSDLKLPALEPLIQLFFHLLEFAAGRWSSQEFIALLESPFFFKKQHWDYSEVNLIVEWIESCNIRWGKDAEHRQKLLKEIYGKETQSASGNSGTWRFLFERLLAGLIQTSHPTVAPFAYIESSQGELLGELIELFQALERDLSPFSDGSHLLLAEWGDKLQDILSTYFYTVGCEEQVQPLLKIIDSFRKMGSRFDSVKVPFATIQKHLEYALSQSSTRFKESNLQTVRFCSLLPLRTVPAKVVVLMGMEEGAFPRHEVPLSFDLIHKNPLVDYCPSRGDLDRFIFLEALLSARQKIVFTYQACNPQDLKEQGPSLLIEELVGAVAQGYQTTIPHQIHSLNRFDPLYFKSNSPCRSYIAADYAEALSYLSEKSATTPFINHFPIPEGRELDQLMTPLSFEELRKFYRDPLKTFFNSSLGIYLEEEQKDQGETFVHTPLEFSAFNKALLKQSLEEVLKQAHELGHLPVDPFIHSTKTRLQESLEGISRFGITPDQIEEIEFELTLSIPLKGKLPLVTPEGLLLRKKKTKDALMEAWPSFLVYLCLKKGKPNLLFLKDGKNLDGSKIDPIEELEKLIAFYQKAAHTPILLDPQLINGKASYSPYVQWMERRGEILVAAEWADEAGKLFGAIERTHEI